MKHPVKIQTYKVISRAVDEGVAYGLRRYNKYSHHAITDSEIDVAAEHVEREVLNALCEVIDFGDNG